MFNNNSNKNFFANLAGINKNNENSDEELLLDENAKLVSSGASKSTNTKSNKDEEVVEINSIDKNDEFDDIEGQLTIDVYQDDNHIYIESPVAGVDPENLDISITPESVSIKGKRGERSSIKSRDYLYQECFWGNFSRSVILPQEIDPDRTSASLKNGILKISLTKINRMRSKKVKVKII